MTSSSLEKILPLVPRYGAVEFRRLVENTIGAIHQIPPLLFKLEREKYELKQIQAYFGRSSASEGQVTRNLYNRFQTGMRDRNHEYGMVFARCTIRHSLRYEHQGIRVLDVLKDNDGLCISNNSFYGAGRVGSTEPGYLYMTFRALRSTREHSARVLSKMDILEIVREREVEIDQEARDYREPKEDLVESLLSALVKANDTKYYGEHTIAMDTKRAWP